MNCKVCNERQEEENSYECKVCSATLCECCYNDKICTCGYDNNAEMDKKND